MAHIVRATAVALMVTFSSSACAMDVISGGEAQADTDPAEALYLQKVADDGPDPFTGSTANETPQEATTPTHPSGRRIYAGNTAGLYGGTQDKASCDVNKQIEFLAAHRDKQEAFAKVLGLSAADVPGYLQSLTSVVVRADTRVTNHGFKDGASTRFSSVLQAGTAVLVDSRGVPRVRCACGNPLTRSTSLKNKADYRGTPWKGFRADRTVIITPAPQPIVNIVIVDVTNNIWIERPVDDDDQEDEVLPDPPPDPYDPDESESPDPDESDSPDPDESDSPDPDESESEDSPSPDSPSPSEPTPSEPTPSPSEPTPPEETDAPDDTGAPEEPDAPDDTDAPPEAPPGEGQTEELPPEEAPTDQPPGDVPPGDIPSDDVVPPGPGGDMGGDPGMGEAPEPAGGGDWGG
ncbi:hypothetical protein G5C51_06655 [Streptomyces sp. A7024]|uniref:DUF6777 domain-containing protein n=1 Tax=Streptomyces coryli TaxID=1128680 RepID=A0A6G4TVW7_9ACTN|nr:DUF6777 domain-containing protein [Streptomyces coryli]NGN63586.1 hypothetical protein [Streptomyces coryli]